MTTATSTSAGAAARPAIGFFERYLTIWVALCIVAGIALGQLLPGVSRSIGALEIAKVMCPWACSSG